MKVRCITCNLEITSDQPRYTIQDGEDEKGNPVGEHWTCKKARDEKWESMRGNLDGTLKHAFEVLDKIKKSLDK